MWPRDSKPEPFECDVTVEVYEHGNGRVFVVTRRATRERGVIRSVAAALEDYRTSYVSRKGERFAQEFASVVVTVKAVR